MCKRTKQDTGFKHKKNKAQNKQKEDKNLQLYGSQRQ
jgi:hypothetical protein